MIPGLLGRDGLKGVAEEVRVIHRDWSDHRDLPVGDIGGIPSATHADLDHRDIDRRVGEGGIGDGDQHLEIGHPRSALGKAARIDDLDDGDHLLIDLQEALDADRLTAEGDPFAQRMQMRRGEPAHAKSAGAQQTFGDPGGGGLAIGPGDVDDREGGLRVAEEVHHGSDPGQIRLQIVLRRARQDRLLHLAHALELLELLCRFACGRIGCRGHASIVAASQPVRVTSGPAPRPGQASRVGAYDTKSAWMRGTRLHSTRCRDNFTIS